MAAPVIARLEATAYEFDIAKIIALLIQFYAAVPKNAFTTHELYERTISLSDTLSRYALTDQNRTKGVIADEVTAALRRILQADSSEDDPATQVLTIVSIVTLDETRYNIEISVTVVYRGNEYKVSRNIVTDDLGRLLLTPSQIRA